MQKIFLLLRARTSHDFSNYKASTIRRRVERRMNVHQISEPMDYVAYLQENPAEIDILFKELLISVTSFFRDPKAFQSLAEGPLTERLRELPENYTFRVWVAGCATGEEAFSIAIVLRECMERAGRHFDVQIFATDLDAEAIDTARSGVYPEGVANDVSPQRLERFFSRHENSFHVCKEIREMVIFALQNVIKDPPFTKLDLVSCRNLLIYLNAELQKRLLPIFHYAIKPGGLLFLGPSETVGQFSDLFQMRDKKWKIFERLETKSANQFLPEMPAQRPRSDHESKLIARVPGPDRQVPAIVEQMLLERHCPPSVLVNDRGEIIHIHGRTGLYLEPATGQPRMNILDMAREGLQLELASAIRQANAEHKEVTKRNINVRTNGDFARVNITAAKMMDPETIRGLLLISFQLAPEPEPPTDGKAPVSPSKVRELEDQLQHSKESLQTIIEELQTSNEELKSTNEELQSTNEELQSTNEEMETSKEEMQSLNEELTTVNNELEAKIHALAQANDDMQNLLNSTSIATIFLDNELNIKRYTAEAKNLIKLIQTDVGRPIGDLASNLDYDHLVTDCQLVLRTLAFQETEVRTDSNRWYLMRIMPYRTSENVIDGLVLTFVEISAGRQSRDYFESIVQTVREPLVVLDDQLRIVSCNTAFHQILSDEIGPGTPILSIERLLDSATKLQILLTQTLSDEEPFHDHKIEIRVPDAPSKAFLLNGRKLKQGEKQPTMILLAMEEIIQ